MEFYQNKLIDADVIQSELKFIEQNHKLPPAPSVSASFISFSTDASASGSSSGLYPTNFFSLENSSESRIGKSFANENEIQYVMALLEDLKSNVSSCGLTIGIISPYKAQINRLRTALQVAAENENRSSATGICKSIHPDIPLKTQTPAAESSSSSTATSIATGYYDSVEVNTVDGFQGKEKDIIIVSCVRNSHSSGRGIGFVSDTRRINVAITRARKCLIIVGSNRTLSVDSTWQRLIASMHADNRIKSVSLPFQPIFGNSK
jgi:superfamily I DNA and/or RNA helicase